MGRHNGIGYHCPDCQEIYSPSEAAELGFHCHSRLVRRTGRELGRDLTGPATYQPLARPEGQKVIQVVPPALNEIDPTVVEQILGSMTEGPLSLELAGDSEGQMLLVRGPERLVGHARAQLEAGYGQIGFRDLDPEEDLAHRAEGAVVAETVALRRPAFFPIRTWRQFGGSDEAGRHHESARVKTADPIRVLVGALDGLDEGEAALVQLVLQRRAPEGWADTYQGSAQQVDFRVKAASAPGQARGALLAGGMLLAFLDVIFACFALSSIARHGLSPAGLGPLFILAIFAAISAGAGYWGVIAWRRLTTQLNANPEVVRQKVSEAAFYTQLRFWAWAPTPEQAGRLRRRLLSSYAVFNLAEGNAFVATGQRPEHPVDLAADGVPEMLLNLSEVAGLWHMPVGALPDRMHRQMFFRRVPLEISRPSPGSVFIGNSSKGGEPVYLPLAAVESGIFLDGKPQVGKSNVEEIIAADAMRDTSRAVVVIDPHQDMVRRLMGLVPPERVADVRCLDMGNRNAFPGINLLDMSVGIDVDKVVSDVIVTGKALWSEYWGPRMEPILRYTAKTIALINQYRVAGGHPEKQLTVLFIPRLLVAPPDKRKGYLAVNLPPVRNSDVTDVLWWWTNYYDYYNRAQHSLMQQAISPVITKIFHLSGHDATRFTFGQPTTTLDLREAIRERRIVLVNTGAAFLGQDVGAFIGALVLNYLDAVVREQGVLPREQRVPLTVVVDEFQSIRDGVSWRDFLGQLRKFGAHVTLGTQSLAGMREDNRELPGEVLAGVMTTVAFQVNAEDADYLGGEFDNSVPPQSLINLSPFHAYVKTVGPERQRLPTFELRMRPPLEADPSVYQLVADNMSTYSKTAREVEETYGQFSDEPIDEMNKEAVENARMMSEYAGSQQMVTQDELLTAALAMGTRSSQNYGPRSGSVGRGVKTRRRGRPGAMRGFSVAAEG